MGQKKLPPDPVFSAYLAACRASLGWTYTKTAAFLGLSVRGYMKYEDGETAPLTVMQEGIRARFERLMYGPASPLEKKFEPGKAEKRK